MFLILFIILLIMWGGGFFAFHIAGGASMRAGTPLNCALRDVETVLTHRMVVDRVLPAAGRALLGIGTPPPDL